MAPSPKKPLPAIEPALTRLSPAGPLVPEKSNSAPELAMSAALPAVALPPNRMNAALLAFTVALASVPVSSTWIRPPLWLMVALPAVLPTWNDISLVLLMTALPAVPPKEKVNPPALAMVAPPAEAPEKIAPAFCVIVILAVPALLVPDATMVLVSFSAMVVMPDMAESTKSTRALLFTASAPAMLPPPPATPTVRLPACTVVPPV